MRTEISVNATTTYVAVDLPDFRTVITAPDGTVHPMPSDLPGMTALAGNLDRDAFNALYRGLKEHLARKHKRVTESADTLDLARKGMRRYGADALIAAIKWPDDVEAFYQAEKAQWTASGWIVPGSRKGSFKITAAGEQAIIAGEMPSPTEDNQDTVRARMTAAWRLMRAASA
jgi:hypothetical protein